MYSRTDKAIFSIIICLSKECSDYATKFAVAMKHDDYLKIFATYNPNSWCYKSCDPDFTDINWPCRGTTTTCRYTNDENCKDGKPCSTSCWRFAFRFHLQESENLRGPGPPLMARGTR